MKKQTDKARAALDLYRPGTLLTKLHELYLVNPGRFAKPGAGAIPVPSLPPRLGDHPDERPNPSRDGFEVGSRTKTIYFLVHCFYPFSQGGTERFVYNMARQAQQDGHRVKVVTYNPLETRHHFHYRVAGILYDQYQLDGLDIIEYRHSRAPRGILHDILTEDPDVDEFVRFLFQQERPDIVHAAYLQKVASFLSACRRLGVPYGITFTSFFALCHFDIMIDKQGALCGGSQGGRRCAQLCGCGEIADPAARHQRMAELLETTAFLSAPSRFVQAVISREFPLQEIRVIPHGVSRQFSPDQPAAGLGSLPIRDFAYFGNMTPIKGVHLLISAFRDMPPDCNLNIYGSGPESYLRGLRRLMRGKPNIRLHGNIPYDQVQQAYAANQVVVVPSIWYETYNFVIHEALLMGKLVIAARIGAMPELIRDGINGLSFTPGDAEDLHRCLLQAVAGDLRIPCGTGQINTIAAESACYHNIYESVLEEAARP